MTFQDLVYYIEELGQTEKNLGNILDKITDKVYEQARMEKEKAKVMTEKSAIEKMVDRLGFLINNITERETQEDSYWRGAYDAYENAMDESRRLAAEEKAKPAPVEAKATAEGSLVEYPCPTCGAERFKTERRMNGDSWCRYGHKHPTKDFVRPASPAVEELVRELRGAIKTRSYNEADECATEVLPVQLIKEILAKYDNAKGGK